MKLVIRSNGNLLAKRKFWYMRWKNKSVMGTNSKVLVCETVNEN